MKNERVLILGGAGMVGLQVAREAAREMEPAEIVISALTREEVDEAVAILEQEARDAEWTTKFTGEAADIFLPQQLQGRSRAELVNDREAFDVLFDDIFSSAPDSYRSSALFKIVEKYRPDVIVDGINTATAISYQDVFTISRKVKMLIDRAEKNGEIGREELPSFIHAIRELLAAQGVPQIVRHILYLHRVLKEGGVRVYVKIGTTGTGGMGVNIPFTHSEERPSATLLSKSAIGFAHTGLLFLLARTPRGVAADEEEVAETHGTIVKEVKPGAMIGFKRLGMTHVKIAGPAGKREPAYLITPRTAPLGRTVEPREDYASYPLLDGQIPLKIIGADTGENGFFSLGEFQAITYPRQMEFVTPEECARVAVLEILGASTGRDVISAIDGAITEPSYRAGVLRDKACREMERLEQMIEGTDALPSIAVGHLGPPRLSKLLIEAYLLRAAAGSSDLETMRNIPAAEMGKRVCEYLEANPRVVSLVTTIGIPILKQGGKGVTLTRGPRLNIPVPATDGAPIPLDSASLEKFAWSGWVDLRPANFEAWNERLQRASRMAPDVASFGSAAFDRSKYLTGEFVPGDFVGWLLTNETDDMGMVGHRLF